LIYGNKHAVILPESSTTSEEADDEADDSDDDDEQCCAVDVATEELKVITVDCLHHRSADNEYQTDNLCINTSQSSL